MTDDRDLEGLDPYDLMDAEAARLDRFFAGLDAAAWSRPSRCAGWSVRDLMAHLLASEQYNAACLDGTVGDFLASVGAKGATDLSSANELGIRELDDRSPQELLEEWRVANAATRAGFRARDGGDIDSSVGAVFGALAGVPSRVRARGARRRRRGAGAPRARPRRASRGRPTSAGSR